MDPCNVTNTYIINNKFVECSTISTSSNLRHIHPQNVNISRKLGCLKQNNPPVFQQIWLNGILLWSLFGWRYFVEPRCANRRQCGTRFPTWWSKSTKMEHTWDMQTRHACQHYKMDIPIVRTGIFHIHFLGHDSSTSYLDSSSWPILNHIIFGFIFTTYT